MRFFEKITKYLMKMFVQKFELNLPVSVWFATTIEWLLMLQLLVSFGHAF